MAEYTHAHWNELIDKYRNGTISADERFRLEKQALDDPFLFDALEGFSVYESRDKESKVAGSRTRIFTLPRVAAAAFVAVLAAVTIIMKTDNTSPASNRESIAMVLEEKTGEGEISENSSASKKEDKSTAATVRRNEPVRPPSSIDKPKANKSESGKVLVENQAEMVNTQPAIGQAEKPTIDIVEQSEEELANIPTNDMAIIENKTNDENLTIADDVLLMDEDQDVAGNSEKLEVVSVQDSNQDVMNKQSAKVPISNTTDIDQAESRKKRTGSTAIFEAVPVIGKKYFDEYAKERIEKRGLRQEPPQEVTIEFVIDKNGNLTDFHHIYTGCPECGPFAISILQNSGEWKTVPPGYSGKARYTFTF